MKRATLTLITLLTLTGCSLIPRDGTPDTFIAKRAAKHRGCQQALEQGWCYDDCRHKPPTCCEPKNVRCSADGLCVWEGCDGELIFGAVGP